MVIATVIVFFVGQVKCPHHPDQLSERSQASKVTLDCFENLKIVSSQVVPGIENIFVFKDVFFVVSLSFSSNSGMFSHKLFGKCPYGNNTFQKGAFLNSLRKKRPKKNRSESHFYLGHSVFYIY